MSSEEVKIMSPYVPHSAQSGLSFHLQVVIIHSTHPNGKYHDGSVSCPVC